jgi:hypothetical protein
MLEWLQNPFVAIAVAVGAMFFGYFFGLAEGRGQGYKRRKEEEAEQVEKNEPRVELEPLPPDSPALPPEEDSLLNVTKDNSGALRLKLDGQRIEAEHFNPEQRKRLIAVLTKIRPWLEAPEPAQQTPPKPQARPAPATAPRPVSATQPVSPPAVEEAEVVAAPDSIVGQIDSILHAQLAGTSLMEKGIRLQEAPDGGVIVWVGIQKYQGVDDVPDEQIKAAIRTAISAWESKYTPGIG